MSEKEELRAMFQELTEYEKQKVGLGIDGLPAIWVIAPDGKILAEGLHGEALVDFCTSLFQN